MGDLVDLALGIVSSMGGFVDIGELVFLTQAGSKFAMSLVWVLVLGTVGVILFSEMAGRLAAVSGITVFKAVELKLGRKIGLVALVSSVLVTVITATAEIGGMALVMRLATAWPFAQCATVSALLIAALVALLPFSVFENLLGVLGLAMLVFLAAVFFKNSLSVPELMGQSVSALQMDGPRLLLYLYFAVGILTSSMMPYEIVFYASGAVEEEWTTKQLPINRLVAGVGFSFGFLVAASLVLNAATKLGPRGIDPQLLGASALEAVIPFGWWGLWLALLGMFAALAGAASETSLSIGYMVCQFFDKPWGKGQSLREAPLFHGLWVGCVAVALVAVLLYPHPIQIAELAVIFSVLALPLTHFAVWRAAGDEAIMGGHVNGGVARVGGLAFLLLLVVAAVAAIPLLIVTSGGQIW